MFAFSVVHNAIPPTGRAQSNGESSFCINHPPTVTVPCNATLSQNMSYYCKLNTSDIDGGNVTVIAISIAGPGGFNFTRDGVLNFTPNQTHVGNHTIYFTVIDDSNCLYDQGNTTFNFSVANINDPPYLRRNIPTQHFPVNTTLAAFSLNDYFIDPDGDPLNYTSTIPSTFSVTITNTSLVFFSSSTCNNEGEFITFTAKDPYNATADSNLVKVKVDCAPQSSGQSELSPTGGAGGGGGASANTCRERWECEEWFACLPTGLQWRRCYDLQGCKPDYYQKRNCTFYGPPPACTENWLCDEWGKCLINNTQYRLCTDLNACGSTALQPPVMQHCTYEPTCNDGVQNGDEEGIDCGGGLCPICPIVQQPLQLSPAGGLSTWLLIMIILSILIVSGVAHYYRAQIAQLIARLGFMLTHRAYKDVLLDAAARQSLFERIRAYENDLTARKETKPDVIYTNLANLVRGYYVEALGVHMEAIPEEVDARAKELQLRAETTALLNGLFAKLPILEQEELEFDEYFLFATLEELRTLVCLTSDYRQDELMRPIEEIPISDKMSFYDEIFARSINAMRAVQFNQVDAAEKEYMTILTRYDPLSEAEKEQIYPELQWLFRSVKFRSEITGARIIEKKALAVH